MPPGQIPRRSKPLADFCITPHPRSRAFFLHAADLKSVPTGTVYKLHLQTTAEDDLINVYSAHTAQ